MHLGKFAAEKSVSRISNEELTEENDESDVKKGLGKLTADGTITLQDSLTVTISEGVLEMTANGKVTARKATTGKATAWAPRRK